MVPRRPPGSGGRHNASVAHSRFRKYGSPGLRRPFHLLSGIPSIGALFGADSAAVECGNANAPGESQDKQDAEPFFSKKEFYEFLDEFHVFGKGIKHIVCGVSHRTLYTVPPFRLNLIHQSGYNHTSFLGFIDTSSKRK
jgi:hypothetical protein